MDGLIPHYELSMMQRMLLIWLFVLCGVFMGFHFSQFYHENPYPWARLTRETKPYWYTFYVFEAFLLSQISYRVLSISMSGKLFGYEEQILNGIWMGLLSLEVMMVAGLAARRMLANLASRPKQKEQ